MVKEAIAKKDAAELVPDYLREDMSSSAGNENIGSDDLLIPRIIQAQALSPQVDKSDPKYIEGLEVGDLFNSLSNAIYPNPTVIVPFAFEKTWPVYKKREHEGGLVGICSSEEEAKKLMSEQDNPDYCEVQPTHVHWVFAQDANDKWDAAAIHMYSTKLTTSKSLNTLIRMRGGARWGCMFDLASKADEIKGKGKFQRLVISNHEGWPSKELVERAKEYHTMVTSNSVRTEYNRAEEKPESDDF